MSEESNKKEFLDEAHVLRKEIRELRTKVKDINQDKETWFGKKEEFSKQIQTLIHQIKEDKKERNQLTAKVKELKTSRDSSNKGIREKIDNVKKLRSERDEVVKKYNINVKHDPSFIMKKIEKLEHKMEIEPMGFEAEKRLMKQIRDLRKQYEELGGVSEVWEKVHGASKEIDQMKKDAESTHKKIQEYAASSQEKHEAIVSNSKKIDELKKEEEEAYKKFFALKQDYTVENKVLKEKLNRLKELEGHLQEDSGRSKKEKKKDLEKELRSKEEVVLEKIRNNDKLTTEDLLIMQQMETIDFGRDSKPSKKDSEESAENNK
ncbi:hypothetical protein H6504_00645 [Candidatus Woesearchaeota archaeon]|nr:hypothetical protein [Candidatus Woesearchaeota archaeon]